MRYLHHSILLLICLTVLLTSFVIGQEKTTSTSCDNQMIYPNADFDNFETPVTRNVKQILEQETDLTDGFQSELIKTTNYSESGKIIDSFLTTPKIKMFGKTIYSYDKRNQLVKVIIYNPDGSAVMEDIYIYDSEGNLKQILTRNVKTKIVIWKKDFSYDAKKKYAEFIDHLRDYGFGFVKDEKCRMTEVIAYDSKRNIKSKVLINYDDKQNIVEQIIYSTSGTMLNKKKSEFEFDSKGNWIKETRFELVEINGKLIYQPIKMINRKITYFDTK